MMSSLPTNERSHTYSCWFAARRARPRIYPLNLQRTALAIISRNQRYSHLHRSVHCRESKKHLRPSRPRSLTITAVHKSP
jgi:hypothetical protein